MVDIVPYPTKKQKLRQPAAEWLPSTPFLMGVSGPSMSGKGVLIQSLIMRPELYHDEKGDPVWDEIHYWTGSAKLDVNLEGLKNGPKMSCIKTKRILLFEMASTQKR